MNDHEYLRKERQFDVRVKAKQEAKNAYDKEREKWHHEHNTLKNPNHKKIILKPDPATIEAELRLEEQLWAS